jgi:hypothetical protein
VDLVGAQHGREPDAVVHETYLLLRFLVQQVIFVPLVYQQRDDTDDSITVQITMPGIRIDWMFI